MSWNWVCPFCDRPQTVTENQVTAQGVGLPLSKNKYGSIGMQVIAIACANHSCQEVQITAQLHRLTENPHTINVHYRSQFTNYAEEAFDSYTLRPESSSRYQPEYIPKALREDYYEACAIRHKSPKASATLSRRCLQGMIRDFCKIAKGRLDDEIKALRQAVDGGTAPAGVTPETIDAIDSVRSVGNIGAHMEKDINMIVEVDPDEAQIMIELIELLFIEWYVARHIRAERIAKVTALAATKKAEIAALKNPQIAPPDNQSSP